MKPDHFDLVFLLIKNLCSLVVVWSSVNSTQENYNFVDDNIVNLDKSFKGDARKWRNLHDMLERLKPIEAEKLEKEFKAKLKNRSRTRKIFLVSILTFLVIWCFGVFVLVGELKELRNLLFYPALFVWIVILVSGLYLHNAKCPQCGNKFSAQSEWPYI